MTERRTYPPREPSVVLVCRCGAEFARPAWKIRQRAKQGHALYCSRSCAHEAHRTRTPESKVEYHRLYREENRELIREKQKAARKGAQRDHILARDKAIYRRNLEANRQRAREYASKHREEAKARRAAWPEQNPERHDFHVARSSLAQSVGLRPRDIPDELAEAKAEQLKISRWVKKQRAAGGNDGLAANRNRAETSGRSRVLRS